ncbi:unnamed protein product [Phytophthora lilii]|uniref:Unnamed protein product n=1 Tax=Phytophthora lilii TaxID=2077276 RepID=A0A9W7CLU2_9STRA|nr:unnamed protein product [Phytophthora lilii]
MSTTSAIAGRFGSTMPPYNIPLYVCSNIGDDAVARKLNFESSTTQRHDYQAHDRFGKFSKRGQLERLHNGALEAGVPCAVPLGIACSRCRPGAARLTDSDANGYTGIRVPDDLKELRAVVAREALNVVGDYNVRTVVPPAVHGGLRTPSPFPERPPSGRSAVPTYPVGERILSNEYENETDLGPELDDPQCAQQSSALHPSRPLGEVVVAETRSSYSQRPADYDPVARLEAVERLQASQFAQLKQELPLCKAQLAKNVKVEIGTSFAKLSKRVAAFEAAGHQT